jgi:hypothetical protein
MPLPRATAWHRDQSIRRMTQTMLIAMGFSTTDVETSMFRFERGYPPRNDFEVDTFNIFNLMNKINAYKQKGASA